MGELGVDQPPRIEMTPRMLLKAAPLRDVFNSDRKRRMDAQIARLAVLYEDMRIELAGAASGSIPLLDTLNPSEESDGRPERVGAYRRHYFVRRSIGTLREFADSLRLLDRDPDFPAIRHGFDATTSAQWAESIDFFQKKESFINLMRNDVGGHFGLKAAVYAVDNLKHDAIGRIGFLQDTDVQDTDKTPRKPLLYFAGEIAATALLRHVPGNDISDDTKRFEAIFDCVMEAYTHAIRSVQILIVIYFYPRFGR